ncbi:RNA-directed DNA polymerase, eukaryota, reverse transcriptase zinc-binding domain protein [Tanacetum coccineum]
MATKRKPSKRQVRVPLKFSDHVVKKLSQKRIDDGSDGVGDEIKAGCGSENGDFRDKDVVTDKGVFGNADNYFEAVTPNVSDTQSSGNIDKNVFVNNPEKVNEVNNMDTDVTSDNTQVNKVNNVSYAIIVNNQTSNEDNKLKFKPTVINEDGNEFVVFDEDLVSKGSGRWRLTLCGYFVGCKMSTNELNYNLRRMWSKYGLLDVKAHTNGNCFFKFRNEAGLNEVLEKGPWIVNNRPMFVQKWDPIIGMDKKEMSTIPIWAKLTNVPLEAWSNEGISALASRLGKPLIMDNMTTRMCKHGSGKMEYARVLVEFDVKKGFKDKIVIQYRNKENEVKGSKTVNVEYLWKPDICSHCSVFGHDFNKCGKRPKTVDEIEKERENVKPIETDAEGFIEVNYKKNAGQKRTDNVVNSSKNDFNCMRKNDGLWRKKTGNNGKQSMQDPNKESNTVQNKTWPLQKEDFNAM